MSHRGTTHRLFHVLVVVDGVLWWTHGVNPAVIHQNLSSMRFVFQKVGVARIDSSHLGICERKVAVIVERSPIPVRIVKDKVLPEVSSCRFSLAQHIVFPAGVVTTRQTFAAWCPPGDNLLAGA